MSWVGAPEQKNPPREGTNLQVEIATRKPNSKERQTVCRPDEDAEQPAGIFNL